MNETPSKLFVYGSLKPGELGFEQIQLLVKNTTGAELHNYGLYVRDGLPVIKPEPTGEIVKGNILEIIEGKEFERIIKLNQIINNRETLWITFTNTSLDTRSRVSLSPLALCSQPSMPTWRCIP
jgi:gamma-glutamylcyclotransferase (GGCT)/AIG2-like uncharacterized protein YtfP